MLGGSFQACDYLTTSSANPDSRISSAMKPSSANSDIRLPPQGVGFVQLVIGITQASVDNVADNGRREEHHTHPGTREGAGQQATCSPEHGKFIGTHGFVLLFRFEAAVKAGWQYFPLSSEETRGVNSPEFCSTPEPDTLSVVSFH